jgi:hypothetical protein
LTRASRIRTREGTISSIDGVEKVGYPLAKEWNWPLTLYANINSKWITS